MTRAPWKREAYLSSAFLECPLSQSCLVISIIKARSPLDLDHFARGSDDSCARRPVSVKRPGEDFRPNHLPGYSCGLNAPRIAFSYSAALPCRRQNLGDRPVRAICRSKLDLSTKRGASKAADLPKRME